MLRRPLLALLIATLSSCGAASYPRQTARYPMGNAETVAQAQAEGPGWTDIVAMVTGDDESGGGASGPPMATTSAVQPPPREMLVVEGWLRVRVEDVRAVAEAVRARTAAAGGTVVQDELSGEGKGPTNGNLRLRLPPVQVEPFLAWLGAQGDIEYRRIQGTDVSREYFDRELALQNQRLTLGRLQKLLDNPNLDTKAVLEIEKELTRVRGEIEKLEGAQRFLTDRAAMATLEIALVRRGGAVFGPEAKLHPGVRGSFLFDIAGDAEVGDGRPGIGINLNFSRLFTIDLDFMPEDDGRDLIVLVTMGVATYSDFLGGGRRHFFNPYLGLRMGAGSDGGARFVAEGEIGVELIKFKPIMVESWLRLVGLFGDGSSAKLQVGAAVSVPF